MNHSSDVCASPIHWSGAKNMTMMVAGIERTFRLSTPYAARPCVPPEYGSECGVGPPMQKVPLVIYWHGCNGHMPLLDYNLQISKLEEAANTEGYFAITPVGTRSVWGGQYGWNSDGIKCASSGADDIAFFEALLAFASAQLCIDVARVHLAGFSTGAFLTYGLACRFPDKIAGAGTIAGGLSHSYYKTCAASHGAVPMQAFHSASDPTVPYNGTALWAGQPEMDALWRARNGCDGTEPPPVVTFQSDTTKCVEWACKRAPVETCTLQNIDHCWYGGRSGGFASCAVRPGDVDATARMFAAWERRG
jgi:polyhydroxybutyrate depolymerase